MEYSIAQVEQIVHSLLPDNKIREISLLAFRDAVLQADIYGSNKWGVYCLQDRIRLLVGSFIVFTIGQDGLWLALDGEMLETSRDKSQVLESLQDWQWDTHDYPEYFKVPSKNGYYAPSENHSQAWPVVRDLHFEFIRKVALRYKSLRKDSQQKHMPVLLEYLRNELEQHFPEPRYPPDANASFGRREDFVLPEEICASSSLQGFYKKYC